MICAYHIACLSFLVLFFLQILFGWDPGSSLVNWKYVVGVVLTSLDHQFLMILEQRRHVNIVSCCNASFCVH